MLRRLTIVLDRGLFVSRKLHMKSVLVCLPHDQFRVRGSAKSHNRFSPQNLNEACDCVRLSGWCGALDIKEIISAHMKIVGPSDMEAGGMEVSS